MPCCALSAPPPLCIHTTSAHRSPSHFRRRYVSDCANFHSGISGLLTEQVAACSIIDTACKARMGLCNKRAHRCSRVTAAVALCKRSASVDPTILSPLASSASCTNNISQSCHMTPSCTSSQERSTSVARSFNKIGTPQTAVRKLQGSAAIACLSARRQSRRKQSRTGSPAPVRRLRFAAGSRGAPRHRRLPHHQRESALRLGADSGLQGQG